MFNRVCICLRPFVLIREIKQMTEWDMFEVKHDSWCLLMLSFVGHTHVDDVYTYSLSSPDLYY